MQENCRKNYLLFIKTWPLWTEKYDVLSPIDNNIKITFIIVPYLNKDVTSELIRFRFRKNQNKWYVLHFPEFFTGWTYSPLIFNVLHPKQTVRRIRLWEQSVCTTESDDRLKDNVSRNHPSMKLNDIRNQTLLRNFGISSFFLSF